MRILVVGSGGREHALVWKIAQSKLVDKIFCSPGNGGISELAECVDIKAEDISKLAEFAFKEKIDLTIVGSEVPLVNGIVDLFQASGLKIFGPDKKCAQLEGSKIFAKEFLAKYKIPTADFKIFDNSSEAKKYIEKLGTPCVVKADGLAAGKGVVVAKTIKEAQEAVDLMLEKKVFGDAGKRIIIEECLEGQEASILVITDSDTLVPLASSQDHKRVFDHDIGPNTGGMGAYSPAPVVTESLFKEIFDKILHPVIVGFGKEKMVYRGILYVGIMITKLGPKVLEFNVRFGDPETQSILPRLKSDLLEIMLATVNDKLLRYQQLEWDSRACVSVVCVSAGYPGDYEKGKEIFGLTDLAKIKDVVVFHAGTRKEGNGMLTSGGRVLGITGLGSTIKEAINKTYQAVEKIKFSGMHYRKDIGEKALKF